jgi:hypothetical protein
MDFIIIVTALTAMASCIAAIYAAKTARTAAKAYTLAIKQDRRHHTHLDLYLDDYYIIRHSEGDGRIFCARLRITNKSASRNSIKEICLFTQYNNREGPPSRISFYHNPGLLAENKYRDTYLTIPSIIEHYSTVEDSVAFIIPDEIIRKNAVDYYKLKVVGIDDHVVEVDANLPRVKDHGKMEKDRNSLKS